MNLMTLTNKNHISMIQGEDIDYTDVMLLQEVL